ncbi:S8 family serine peptidase [Lentzea albida]|uniref:Subtilase family protein n=1 Tax=Lentzea albida TaxID=65499 RepID=A0A1H9VJU9_9PSEU|nr:S8 family serine peptidase [Lentzea albida]SES21985.1 Subtilase family protein [Lentzea albida]
MKRNLPLAVAGVVLATALSGATHAAATTAETTANTTAGPQQGAASEQWITLVTGDQVLTDDKGKPKQWKPAPGREHIMVATREDGAHLYAVPQDVEAMISEGRLDRRLFDLALLSRPEYTKRKGLGVLVSGGTGLRNARQFSRIGVDAVTVTAETAPDVWKSLANARTAKTTIWLDAVRKAALDRSTAQIGAPQAWQAGFDGTGVKIAVLDTGVDNTHPDLATQEIAEKNFTDSPDNVDRVGHGTHVASIAAGTGAKSGGKFRGVAPGARILDGKVLGDDGSGFESGILAGMEWAVEQQADVVNMSLGGDDGPLLDPMEVLVNKLSQETGTLFVIASGNSGPNSVGSPGSADAALTVGAVDRDDELAPFSSTGPRNGDGAIKPDITAPGVEIGAAAAGVLGETRPKPADGYIALSGTSMATPHVTGAAAILAQVHPDWNGEQLKAALTASAKPGAHTPFEQGAGRADIAKAIKQTVTSSSVSFGTALWPHNDDVPMTRDVVYRNEGDQPVTLALKLDTAAPQGFFTLKDATLTVPAHGTATTTLTADTKIGGDASGAFSAYVNASGGGQSVVTPAAVTREDERYTLTIKAIGRDGKPAADWRAELQGVTGDAQGGFAGLGTGLESLRVPKGRYLMTGRSWVEPTQPNPNYNWFNGTNIDIAADTTITLDARQAKPVDVTWPGKAEERHSYIRVGHKMPVTEYGFGLLGVPLRFLNTAHVGPEGRQGEMNELLVASYTGADREEFHLADQSTTLTKFWTGYQKQLKSKDVVTVEAASGTTAPDRTGYLYASAAVGDSPLFGVAFGHALPHSRKMYLYSPTHTWGFRFEQDTSAGTEAFWAAADEQFKPGRTYRRTFNTGVFGPALTNERRVGLYRDGDVLFGSLPFFADGQGRSGGSIVDSGSTVLKRGGKVVDSTDRPLDLETFFSLPATPGRYELTTTANRSGVAAISTSVTTTWGFDSATTPAVTQVPLSMVRFTPELGLDGTLPAYRVQQIPLTVQGKVKSLSTQVSYDKGRTWQRTLVIGGSMIVVNPGRGGSVSLRATAVGKGGDSVTQTVIDAYLAK